jgi:hypothetical protein
MTFKNGRNLPSWGTTAARATVPVQRLLSAVAHGGWSLPPWGSIVLPNLRSIVYFLKFRKTKIKNFDDKGSMCPGTDLATDLAGCRAELHI